jgi:hypothetical protein
VACNGSSLTLGISLVVGITEKYERSNIISITYDYMYVPYQLNLVGASTLRNSSPRRASPSSFAETNARRSSVKKKVSRNVGDLIKNLHEKDEAYTADDPDVRSVRILERYDNVSYEGSGDEDHQGHVD